MLMDALCPISFTQQDTGCTVKRYNAVSCRFTMLDTGFGRQNII